jgi:hypothetical protein
MNLIRKLMLMCLFVLSTLAIQHKAHSATSLYGVSCTNTSYGTQLGAIYLESAVLTTLLGHGNTYGMYTSTDCVYSGAGRTNSSAIVGGEIARAAANAVVGAVTGRLSTAMNMNSNTAAHMSYTSNANGVGMAANHLVGGLSLWTNFTSSSFENDQTFSTFGTDTNQYEANAEAFTAGIDKAIGNLIVGLNITSFSSDIDTKANGGNIEVEGETFGIYAGIHTGIVTFSAGAGTGEYDVDTKRLDMGSATTIKGNDITSDIQYYFVNLSATVNRGKISISPRVGYRNFDMDMPAFTDVVPSDSNSGLGAADKTTANEAIGGKTYSSDMTEAGLSIALATGAKLTPYIDVSYVNEDTTKASYGTELSTDGVTELNASSPDGYMAYGGGIILNLSSKASGYLNIMETSGRDDFSETTISGSLKLRF